jgi:peptidoglycan/LPS O-acetylase OafA/YrhL
VQALTKEPRMQNKTKYYNEPEGLRGLMALWVVVGHVLATLPRSCFVIQ